LHTQFIISFTARNAQKCNRIWPTLIIRHVDSCQRVRSLILLPLQCCRCLSWEIRQIVELRGL